MFKQIIFVSIIGLALSFPVSNYGNLEKFETDVTETRAKLERVYGNDFLAGFSIDEISGLIDFIPNDFTLNEIIILITQQVFLAVLEKDPVPEWFYDAAGQIINIIYTLDDYGSGSVQLKDLKPLISLAAHEAPELVDLINGHVFGNNPQNQNIVDIALNADDSITLHSLALEGSDYAFQAIKDYELNIHGLDILEGYWYEILEVVKDHGTSAVNFGQLRPFIHALLELIQSK